MLDVSASMAYGSGAMTKHEYASCLAASIGYLMNRQRDAVGLATFADRVISMQPASARPGHLRALLLTLDKARPADQTDVARPLHQLADSLPKRGMVVLISDLLDEPERVIRGLKHLQFRGADVIVFHLLDPFELDFPFERATRFEDLETDEQIMAVPAVAREHYLRAINGLIERYRRELGSCGIDYQQISTVQPLEMALLAYLSTRERAL
jgi:uncharacterized protein (DUF58 family)